MASPFRDRFFAGLAQVGTGRPVRSLIVAGIVMAACGALIPGLGVSTSRYGLVAEDDPVNQMVVRAILEKASHQIEMVGNGLEAVAAAMRRRFDVILMDVQMPEMDGVTALQKIRELPGEVANTPIIALTANAMSGDREKYLEAGFNEYVSKPIRRETLLEVIGKCCGSRRQDAA